MTTKLKITSLFILENMHKEILTKEQIKLLPLVGLFKRNFGLVGGTAIALQIGHRQSVDFDLTCFKEIDSPAIRKKILKFGKIQTVIRNTKEEYSIIVNGVKITFFWYSFPVKFTKNLSGIIKMPDLLSLAAMKAYALGRRVKWKDYVDLYFILKNHHTVKDISKKGKQIFGNEFNEKTFRNQLVYFKDIDYSEQVIFMKNFKISDAVIKKELVKFSLE
ncbi:MAG: nucleotidyl transferase AbiEii/AbiGii toxin family protein [Patescibacteria group bacterium]